LSLVRIGLSYLSGCRRLRSHAPKARWRAKLARDDFAVLEDQIDVDTETGTRATSRRDRRLLDFRSR